jgi:hypothetical protein
MATKFHGKKYEAKGHSDKATVENWEGPLPHMPESYLGDDREGIDAQINKDDIRKIDIKPRQI